MGKVLSGIKTFEVFKNLILEGIAIDVQINHFTNPRFHLGLLALSTPSGLRFLKVPQFFQILKKT
jgi:hypothetical protein